MALMSDKIQTLHPDPDKQGVNIDRDKYDMVKAAILDAFANREQMTFTEMTQMVEATLDGRFTGSISWYAVTVKLDLEARGTIERIPNTTPQQLRLRSA